MNELAIKELLATYGQPLRLKLIAGAEGLQHTINSSDIHRPGLALTGFVELFTLDQVQLLGNTEVEYLRSLSQIGGGRRSKSCINSIFHVWS